MRVMQQSGFMAVTRARVKLNTSKSDTHHTQGLSYERLMTRWTAPRHLRGDRPQPWPESQVSASRTQQVCSLTSEKKASAVLRPFEAKSSFTPAARLEKKRE